jgi:Fe-S oxidoreductase
MPEEDVKEQLKKDILDILGICINCRFCLPSCPRFDITSGETSCGGSGLTRALYYAVKWEMTDRETLTELRDMLYSCMTCKSCEVACKKLSTATKLMDAIEKGRQLLIEEMIGPMPEQKNALESLHKYGNPYGLSPSKRKAWINEMNIPGFSKEKEILLYIGCTTSYDLDVQPILASLMQLLQKAKINFGTLEDEVCCGYPSIKLGEKGLFEEICEKNLGQFKSSGVKHIITISPHCFNTFSNIYPKEAMEGVKIQHYIQYLDDLIKKKQLVFNKKIEKKVAYHDSCYLGRYNNIYIEPRRVLKSIPGLEVVEFRKNQDDSICCGGGGGRMWSDFESETERIANLRVKEALSVGAETIVTACPWCLINLRDGVKEVNVEAKLAVKDLAELCMEAL